MKYSCFIVWWCFDERCVWIRNFGWTQWRQTKLDSRFEGSLFATRWFDLFFFSQQYTDWKCDNHFNSYDHSQNGSGSLSVGKPQNPGVTIMMKDSDFVQMMTGKLNSQEAFLQVLNKLFHVSFSIFQRESNVSSLWNQRCVLNGNDIRGNCAFVVIWNLLWNLERSLVLKVNCRNKLDRPTWKQMLLLILQFQ